MKKLSVIFLLFGALTCNLYSQDRTLKGRVIDENLETLHGVSIRISDTLEIGTTDLNGFFQVNIPVYEKKILFSSVGLDPTTIELSDKYDKIEVVIMLSGTYDFITLKQADRKRKKRYKKLPEIHTQAFEKGIFESEHACYKRKFEPFYLKKQKPTDNESESVEAVENINQAIKYLNNDSLLMNSLKQYYSYIDLKDLNEIKFFVSDTIRPMNPEFFYMGRLSKGLQKQYNKVNNFQPFMINYANKYNINESDLLLTFSRRKNNLQFIEFTIYKEFVDPRFENIPTIGFIILKINRYNIIDKHSIIRITW